jgi:hypothetical protein
MNISPENDNGAQEFISCPHCKARYVVPRINKVLRITCKHCNTIFYYNLPIKRLRWKSGNTILLIASGLVLVFLLVGYLVSSKDSGDKNLFDGIANVVGARTSNWITISYAGLVEQNVLTHSGETISEVVRRLPGSGNDQKGLVQPYLEPFSVLCHDVVLATSAPDTIQMTNILANYPAGSEEPAWVDLFREGHFQMYYNKHLIRLFIKGTDPEVSYRQFQSVVRHPLQDVIISFGGSIKMVEVYTFSNDYAKREIRLNTIPAVLSVDAIDLAAKRHPMDIASIEDFLQQGVQLEAAEVDVNDELYFYGRKASDQTLAGFPVSISDIAVVYRSIFHYGFNAPYISLDRNEDNRYAKVNFGGNLANTHVGHVVLEADKLFKTLSTGLEPNTGEVMKQQIAKHVSGFLTEDERGFLEKATTGHMQIRYWFYPDSIGTVTDGSIGVVVSDQFLADVERMDIKTTNVGNAVRNTIDHLNLNFYQYEEAFKTYEELSTVGRIMALLNWMKGMNSDKQIELDDLLSIRLPAFSTPKKTKKMFAVSSVALPETSVPTARSVREAAKVSNISHALDRFVPSTSDSAFLVFASQYASRLNASDSASPYYRQLESTVLSEDKAIDVNESKLSSLELEIKRMEYSLNSYNQREVDRFNELVDKYNNLAEQQKNRIDRYNTVVEELNQTKMRIMSICSIGGGINLGPKEFKPAVRDMNSPKLREILRIKNNLIDAGNVAKAGDWVRSRPGTGNVRGNHSPVRSPVSSQPNLGAMTDIVNFSRATNSLLVTHLGLPKDCRGQISPDGKNIVFSR